MCSSDLFTVDVTAPTVTNVTSTLADGAYTVGQVIPVTVTFSEAVTVTGTPRLSLSTGSPATTAVDYGSGSTTTTLTFSYTVASGNFSSDLDYASTGALTLNGGTIRDAAGNNATLTLASPGAAGSLGANKGLVIDAVAPSVTIGAAAASTSGTSIDFGVTVSESVTGVTAADFTLGGTATGFAISGVTGSGASYTVSVVGTSPTEGSVTLTMAAGGAADAVGNLNTVSNTATVLYDTSPPVVAWTNPSAAVEVLAGSYTPTWTVTDASTITTAAVVKIGRAHV